MTEQEIQRLKELIFLSAKYYGKELDVDVIQMQAMDLADLEFRKVFEAFKEYRHDAKNKFPPLPSQIRKLADPDVNNEHDAREAVARIQAAVVRFGYVNGPDARIYMGELAWAVVERFGGWRHLCQNIGISIDPTQFQAQAREVAVATREKADIGYFSPPSLTSSEEKEKRQELKDQARNILIDAAREGATPEQLTTLSEKIDLKLKTIEK